MTTLLSPELPIPEHFSSDRVAEVWKVPYEARASEAHAWANHHGIRPAADDGVKIALVGVDVQNTFCLPGFELFVGGRSGTGAVDDSRRLAEFIYRNLGRISEVALTLDTHQAMQIFHAVFLIDEQGRHPAPYTLVSAEDVRRGRWKFNPAVAPSLGITPEYGQAQLEHYTQTLKERGKYELTIWPYHSMLGGIGHALVASIEEAVFFHTLARNSQAQFIVKGNNALTESYSAIGPEVREGPRGEVIGRKSSQLFELVRRMDAVLIAGQAKSHCVAWTVADLLSEIAESDAALAGKIYLLEDCSSPVVVPGADYTAAADEAYRRFEEQGAHRVLSSDPMESWLA